MNTESAGQARSVIITSTEHRATRSAVSSCFYLLSSRAAGPFKLALMAMVIIMNIYCNLAGSRVWARQDYTNRPILWQDRPRERAQYSNPCPFAFIRCSLVHFSQSGYDSMTCHMSPATRRCCAWNLARGLCNG